MNAYHQPGKFLEVEPGVEIYYEERGAGKPIIFIPGWTFSTEFFAHQLEHFSKAYRAIAIDPRSQGRSSKALHGNDYATHGKDLARLIQALDLKDVVLVGWSFGCLGSWAYVRQEGLQNLRAVVSIDLSPKPLCVNDQDWVEGPLDEIAEAYNTYLTSSQGQRDFVT
jgi:non-heme chloroperoxidase